jgi:hypothetical protein
MRLQDHFLNVAVAAVELGDRRQGFRPVVRRFSNAQQQPRGKRNPQFPRPLKLLQAHLWLLAGRVAMHRLHQRGRDLLQHQPHRGVHRFQLRQLRVAQRARVGVWQKAQPQRQFAQIINSLKPSGAAAALGMHFAAENQRFDDGATGERSQPGFRLLQRQPRIGSGFGTKVAVGAAIEAFVSGDECIGRAVGDKTSL